MRIVAGNYKIKENHQFGNELLLKCVSGGGYNRFTYFDNLEIKEIKK